MSILIKGMEMPIDGNETIIRIQPDGTVLDQYGHHLATTAVPVPPHGDLIERKAAYGSLLNCMAMTGYQSRALSCIDEFCVPTIIPADPAEEGET